jgi:Transposase DDE domain
LDIRQALPAALQDLFGPDTDQLARDVRFIRQPRKLTGSSFAQALVLTWLGDAEARLGTFVAELASADVSLSCQALDKRFNEDAVNFLRALLGRALRYTFRGQRPRLAVLDRFVAVQLDDTTTISLPACLADHWQGCGGRLPGNGAAALKIAVSWDLLSGALTHVSIHDARTHDRACQPPPGECVPGTLRLADLGYFALGQLAAWAQRGVYWLSRLMAGTCVQYAGRWWAQDELLAAHGPRRPGGRRELAVRIGRHAAVSARLLLERVPAEVADQRRADLVETARVKGQTVSAERLALADWTLLVTNVEPERLTVAEALAVYRCRWQIELLFKQWKSDGGLASSRSAKPQRILCEVYAKLIAQLLNHWLLLLDDWRTPAASWRKAAARIRSQAPLLSLALRRPELFPLVLQQLSLRLAADGRIYRRTGRPSTFQRIEAAARVGRETG